MHFTTLLTVEVTKTEANVPEDRLVELHLELLKLKKKRSSKRDIMLDIAIERLEGLRSEFARQVDRLVFEKMEPYGEQTENPKYLEFEDKTEELKQQYETECTDCIKLSNGSILPVDDYFFRYKFCIHDDGKVYQKKFGQLKNDKRSKRAKTMKCKKRLEDENAKGRTCRGT